MKKKPQKSLTDGMILAHFKHSELQYLDNLQGEVIIDPETGLRCYPKLEKLFADPKIQLEVYKAKSNILQEKPFSEKLKSITDMMDTPKDSYIETPVEDEMPVEIIEKFGLKGDDRIAWIPLSVSEFFDDINGGESINPDTGLKQYFLPLVFAALGSSLAAGAGLGTLGTALATGVGAAAGSKLAGEGWKKAGRAAILGAAGNFAGSHLGLGTPGSGGGRSLGSMGKDVLGRFMGGMPGGNALSNMMGGSGSGMPGGNFLSNILGMGGEGGQEDWNNIQGLPWKQGGGGSGGGMGGSMLPMAAIGALLYKGKKDSEKQQRKMDEQYKSSVRGAMDSAGYNTPLAALEAQARETRAVNPYVPDMSRILAGERYDPYIYKSGGSVDPHELQAGGKFTHIKGPGTGQSDEIKASLNPGDYIWDASSTSDLGDGSSEAGVKTLGNFIAKIPSQHYEGGNLGKPIPALLSNDEVNIPAAKVTALGGGSNAKGARILDRVRKNLRAHKNSNKLKLPPAAKPIEHYMKGGKI